MVLKPTIFLASVLFLSVATASPGPSCERLGYVALDTMVLRQLEYPIEDLMEHVQNPLQAQIVVSAYNVPVGEDDDHKEQIVRDYARLVYERCLEISNRSGA